MDITRVLSIKIIATVIAKHLSYISRLSLIRAFPIAKKIIWKELINPHCVIASCLADLISNAGNDEYKIVHSRKIAEEILRALSLGSKLSGSFMLWVLTYVPECIECEKAGRKSLDYPQIKVQDLDVFSSEIKEQHISKTRKLDRHRHFQIPSDNNFVSTNISEFSLELYKSSYKIFDLRESRLRYLGPADPRKEFVKWCTENPKGVFDNAEISDRMLKIRDFFINGLKLQDIIVRRTFKGTEFIRDTFDMDFLKNYYDGNTLTIFNPESILKRRCTVNAFEAYYKGFVLLRGYDDRKIMNRVHYVKRNLERIKKYQNRGFHIDIDNSLNKTKGYEIFKKAHGYYDKSGYNIFEKDIEMWESMKDLWIGDIKSAEKKLGISMRDDIFVPMDFESD